MDNNNRYEEPQYKTLEEALELVRNAVQGEREDELFYNYLISVAPTQEEKDIISSIRDDEMKHNKMFREIYYYFTGEELPRNVQAEFKEPENYIDGLRRALFGELAAMERYRIIRAGLPSKYYRDMVFEILTDELKHADKYNYLLTLNREYMEQVGSMQMTTPNRNRYNQNDNDRYENDQMMSMKDLMEYIAPLVDEAISEAIAGKDLRSLFQKYILIGILIGNGYTSDQSTEQVNTWELNS